MVQLTRIYTKGGDKGRTSLGDGVRVPKNHPLIEAIGTIDEANAFIGLASVNLEYPFKEALSRIQHDLFDIGADLCLSRKTDGSTQTSRGSESSGERLCLTQKQVQRLENELDMLNKELSPLNSFVLPGGSSPSAYLHVARTIVRRAERVLCHLDDLNPYIRSYLNRLSDFLFVLARYLNGKGAEDILWVPGKNQ